MVKFYTSPLQAVVFKDRLKREFGFRKCFSKNISQEFYEDMLTSDNRVYFVFGSTGSGKSTVSIELWVMKDPKFTAEKIAFTNEELAKKVYNSQTGDCFARDETTRDWGEGSGQLIATIQDLTETLRKRKNSFILLSPVIKGHGFVHYYLEVLQASVNLEEKAIKKFIDEGGKEIYFRVGILDRDLNYIGYIIVKSTVNNSVWLDYDIRKDEFLKLMSSGQRVTGLDIIKEAEAYLKELDLTRYPKKGQRLTYIKYNSNYTNAQCQSIAIEMERLIEDRGMIQKKVTKRWPGPSGV